MSHQRKTTFGAILPLLLYTVLAKAAVATTRPAGECTIYGRVTDRSTGEAVELVNVFLANTTRGGSTDRSGRYIMTGIPPGSYQLVASRIGFEMQVKSVRCSAGDSVRFDFRVRARVLQQEEVQVTAVDPSEWREMLKEFKKQFIGQDDFAGDCIFHNPQVLDLEENDHDGALIANTDSVLHLENRALGYRLHVLLSEFRWNKPYNRLYYKHYTRFELIHPEDSTTATLWSRNRAQAYRGSKRHFMQSLFAGTLEEENFAVFRGSIEDILHGRGWYVSPENMAFVDRVSPDYVRLSFQGFLRIQYSGPGEIENNYIALDRGPAFVDANGYVLEPQYLTVLSQSAWADDRIARLMPMDYRPPARIELE